MTGIIEGLLVLAKFGRQPLNLRTTNLNDVVSRVVRRMKTELNARQIEWRINPLPSLVCDETLMERVFTNLLENAVKYTRTREAALIDVGRDDQEGKNTIYVRDNGAGFDMKYADRLFGAFQRLHSQEQFEGTGLGLATVRRIIQRHGWRVWAESQPHKGATFFISSANSLDG